MPNDSGQRPDQDELVVDVGFGVIADDREAEAEGDQRRGERVAQRGDELRGGRVASASASGVDLRRRGHGQTFSTSGRPRMPEGMKISVMARIMNAATSL